MSPSTILRRACSCGVLAALLLAPLAAAAAEIVREIPYKRTTKLAAGKYYFRFALYDGDTAAAALVWEEPDCLIAIPSSRALSWRLGSKVLLGRPFMEFDQQLWLQVDRKVRGVYRPVFSPARERWTVVPYAMHSLTADSAHVSARSVAGGVHDEGALISASKGARTQLTGACQNFASCQLNNSTDGARHVLVQATAKYLLDHVTGSPDEISFTVTDETLGGGDPLCVDLPPILLLGDSARESWQSLPAALPSGAYGNTLSFTKTFPISANTIAQFHLNGGMRATSGGDHRLATAVIECTLVQ